MGLCCPGLHLGSCDRAWPVSVSELLGPLSLSRKTMGVPGGDNVITRRLKQFPALLNKPREDHTHYIQQLKIPRTPPVAIEVKGCRPLTKPETETVLAHLLQHEGLGVRNACFFSLGLNTGFRVSELLSINVGDVLQHGGIVDTVSVRRSNMKGKGEGRTVRLNAKAKSALKTWLDQLTQWGCNDATPLFCSRARKRLSRIAAWRMFDRAFAVIGLTGCLGTHCMRKTYADRMYDLLGGDLKQLQGALGHKWITSTSQYLSFKEDRINAAIDLL